MWINDLLQAPPAHYQDLILKTKDWCRRLKGVKSVALWFDDGDELAAVVLAAWQVGAAVYLLPNDSEAALAWGRQADCFLSDKLPSSCIGQADEAPCENPAITFRLPETATVYLYTSGSTGNAKMVAKTCAQMCAEADVIAQTLPENWRDCQLWASVSLQHLYGFTFRLWVALRMGWRLSGRLWAYPEDWWAASRALVPCVWVSSPVVLNHMRDWQRLPENVLGVISAGGVLSDNILNIFEKQFHLPIWDVYGSTETGVVAWRKRAGEYQLFAQVQARLNEAQCLCVQSAWTDGEQMTADVATLHENRLVLHGRNDRMIKLGDKRISLHQLETILQTHEWVNDVSGCLHRGRVVMWVCLSAAGVAFLRQNGRLAMLSHWKQILQNQVDKIALPRYWRLTAQPLPRNSQGKLTAAAWQYVLNENVLAPDWTSEHLAAHEAIFSGSVPVDLLYFQGHFADFPLVAGVVQLQWVMDLAKQLAWLNAPVAQVENLKYQHFIRPNDKVHIHLRWGTEKGKLIFALTVDGKTCASGRVAFQAAPHH